jgi:hypothetical protein
MFKKEQTERTQLNLNDLINSVLSLLRDELRPQHIILRTNLDPAASTGAGAQRRAAAGHLKSGQECSRRDEISHIDRAC